MTQLAATSDAPRRSLGSRLGLELAPVEKRVLIGAWLVLVATFIVRWSSHQLVLFDTAVTAHVYWRLAHGLSDVSSLTGAHHLGDHLSLVGLVLTPVFRLGTDAGLLVYGALQAASACLVGAAVMTAARRAEIDIRIGRAAALLTLLAPGTYLVTHFGVREFALGVGPLAMVGALRTSDGDVRSMTGWAAVASLVRIEFAASVALFGLLNRKTAAGRRASMVGGAAFVGLAAWLLVGPLGGASAGAHFAHLGGSTSEILRAATSNPVEVLRPIADGAWLRSVVGWLLPAGLVLPLLRPRLSIAALPFVAIPILGVWPLADSYPEHYWHPLLVIGGLALVEVLAMSPARYARPVIFAATAGTAIAWLVFFPWGASWLRPAVSSDPGIALTIDALNDDDRSLAATAPLVHGLLDRPTVYALPEPFVCRSLSGAVRSDAEWPSIVAGPVGVLDDLEALTSYDLTGYEAIFDSSGFEAFASAAGGSGCSDRSEVSR